MAAGLASGAITGAGSLGAAGGTALVGAEIGLFLGATKSIFNQQLDGAANTSDINWLQVGRDSVVEAVTTEVQRGLPVGAVVTAPMGLPINGNDVRAHRDDDIEQGVRLGALDPWVVDGCETGPNNALSTDAAGAALTWARVWPVGVVQLPVAIARTCQRRR